MSIFCPIIRLFSVLNFLANILHGRVSACGDHNAGTLILRTYFPLFFSLMHHSVFWVDPVIRSMICLVTENCYSCSIAPLFSSWKRVLVWWNSECCWADIAYWYYTSWTLFSLFSLSWLLVSPVLIFFFFGLITENDASEWCCSVDVCSFYGIPGLLSRGVYEHWEHIRALVMPFYKFFCCNDT